MSRSTILLCITAGTAFTSALVAAGGCTPPPAAKGEPSATGATSASAPQAVFTTPPPAAGITPVDVPAGYGYPGDRAQMQSWADDWRISDITTSAWDLWGGLTSDSGQSWNGSHLPVWETWCGSEEAFAHGCKALSRPARAFKRPTQIGHTARRKGLTAKADTAVVSFNKFNPSMTGYLGDSHTGPGTASYDYTSQQSLVNLNAAWPSSTPTRDRKVQETPYQAATAGHPGFAAIETKPVMFIVKASGLTPMPLWQGPADSTTSANATPETWLTCVLLDPANHGGSDTAPVAATPAQVKQSVGKGGLACKTYLYAPLSTIYNFQMDAPEAAAWNTVVKASADGAQGLTAAQGDYAVVVGMHVNSKAIVNWTWQTFWWQPGGDTPNLFPGSKQGMTPKVLGAWRNYATCTAWNQTKGNASKNMVVCFNPFLETSNTIPAGQASNCVSCHGTATAGAVLSTSPPTLGSLNYPDAYTAPIDFAKDPRFVGYTHTDFSWAIPNDARGDLK